MSNICGLIRVSNSLRCVVSSRTFSTSTQPNLENNIIIQNNVYKRDDYTNVTDKIASYIGRNLHSTPYHPLNLVKQRIVNYFYKTFVNSRGNPLFSVYDNLTPVVTVEQNFDGILIPKNHPSRLKSDCYYVNRNLVLRGHCTGYQPDFIRTGLDNFLAIGDVYRRDEIDRTHYPVFHQVDAVRLKTKDELFPQDDSFELFESDNTTCLPGGPIKQPCHTLEASKLMEHELKTTLSGLAKELFGEDTQYRWVETTFPFTQPSWELEVYHNGEWYELLGSGVMQQSIIKSAGVTDRVGWAFGLGLERIAMILYKIPDIRLFWSKDSGFLNQFKINNINENITYKAVSQYPQCINDISFWIPKEKLVDYSSNDFYDVVRSIGGDIIEQVSLVDNFRHPKTGKVSHCYRIIYRHMEKTLTNEEVNRIHKKIENTARDQLKVDIR